MDTTLTLTMKKTATTEICCCHHYPKGAERS
jgi:hypothetical protein